MTSTPFELVITFFILLNSICLALESYNMSSDMETFLQYSNYVFTAIFLIEMVLKLIGLGPIGYIKDPFNDFDAIIVIVSILVFLSTIVFLSTVVFLFLIS